MPAVSTQLNDFIMPAVSGSARKPASRPTWLARIADAFASAQARQTDLEIGRLLERNGGRLTDSVEREIQRHFV